MSIATPTLPRVQIRWPRLALPSVWNLVVFTIVVVLVSTPLLFLVLGSFSTARLPSEFSFAGMSLANYSKVWTDPGTYAVFGNTIVFGVGSTAFGIAGKRLADPGATIAAIRMAGEAATRRASAG